MNYPHRAVAEADPSDVEIPDPQFGSLDAQTLTSLLGESALGVARWASYAKAQQETIAALREQVAALRARSVPTVAAPEPATVKVPAGAGKNGT